MHTCHIRSAVYHERSLPHRALAANPDPAGHVVLVCDIHAHTKQTNVFAYACEPETTSQQEGGG